MKEQNDMINILDGGEEITQTSIEKLEKALNAAHSESGLTSKLYLNKWTYDNIKEEVIGYDNGMISFIHTNKLFGSDWELDDKLADGDILIA